MKINVNEIKTGMLLEFKGGLWEVQKTQHVKPGKGGAFNQVEMKNIASGTKLNERFRSNDTIEKAMVEEVQYSFMYNDRDGYHFCDVKTFEQITLNQNMVGEKRKFLSENLEVSISFYNEKPISVKLPNQIECIVTETDSVIKGQTVSSSYKPAILDNDLKIQVPPFINKDDKIVVDTRTIEYIKKL